MRNLQNVRIHPQVNNPDTADQTKIVTDTGAGTKGVTRTTSSATSIKNKPVEKITIAEEDSSSIVNSIEKILFTVPYRSALNIDSLKAESRKVVLEIDTIPKGIQLIYRPSGPDSLKNNTQVFTKSLFSQHLLKSSRFEPKIKAVHQQNWMVIVFMLILFLVGILRVFYQRKFTLFLNAFFSRRFSNQITREENALTQSTSVVLSVVFFLSISMFIFLVSQHYHFDLFGQSGWLKFLFILIACTIFYLLKLLSNKVGGYLFKAYKETDEYIFNQFLVIQILGLLLSICCILLSYSVILNKEWIIYAGFCTLIIGFFVRMIKSFGIVNMNTYSPVYIFLYLCTLEILPLIIIVKLII